MSVKHGGKKLKGDRGRRNGMHKSWNIGREGGRVGKERGPRASQRQKGRAGKTERERQRGDSGEDTEG